MLNHETLEQAGTPREIYAQPRNRFVAEYIGSPMMNFLPCEHVTLEQDAVAVKVEGQAAMRLGGPARDSADLARAQHLGVRPDSWHVGNKGEPEVAGCIINIEDLGGEILLYFECSFGEVIAKRPFCPEFRPGNECSLAPQPGEWNLFDQDGLRTELPSRRSAFCAPRTAGSTLAGNRPGTHEY